MSYSSAAIDGRLASRARRHAMSSGKSCLPPASERVRNAQLAGDERKAVTVSELVVTVPHIAPVEVRTTNGPVHSFSDAAASGRQVSMLRRHASSAGKAALAAMTVPAAADAEPRDEAAGSRHVQAAAVSRTASCREQARARRAEHSRRGSSDPSPARPTRSPRTSRPESAPIIVEPLARGGGRVTGVRLEGARHVTGDERGVALPVSGTQYIGAESIAAGRDVPPKVGLARTKGGALVSGTLVRSRVPITGDERGGALTITGESDQHTDDDVTGRSGEEGNAAAQFRRQTNPHGHFAQRNLALSARSFGSRNRNWDGRSAIESTAGGTLITGSAVGNCKHVTGDEAAAFRAVTGDDYLAPTQRHAEPGCNAPASVARSLNGRRVTGIDIERHPRVTGSASGARAAITGSPYEGPRASFDRSGEASADEPEQRSHVRNAAAAVTGDTPMNGMLITGAARGAAREITGTPYYREPPAQEMRPADPVAAIDGLFSVRSPQRSAQLSAGCETQSPNVTDRITGSFAIGQGKVTGNLEFVFRPRLPASGDVPAHAQLTGEGRANGRPITGEAWGRHSIVTGTEGAFAGARNPSERGGKPHAFAGASRFKALASSEEPKHLVTGMFGYSSDSAAKVTLSGGAQG